MSFTEIDTLAVNTIRTLAPDVVQKANSGHPGAPMGCAPMAHTLYSRFIKANPENPTWINRDRFVLSNGHGCALLYIMLHLTGHNISMDDLKSFRQFHSKTPGHPEANHGVSGIEVSTGPLGQGISNAVGLAMAKEHFAATFNKPEFTLFDNFTYVISGDGCLQEGVQAEAASLAGHLQLGSLIVLYDDNKITIDGDTAIGFSEDVCKRFEAYGWHTQSVADGDSDFEGIAKAVEIAKGVTDKPSLIKVSTIIGYGSKNQGEEKVHGAPLGAADISQVKAKFGFDPEKHFYVPDEVYDYYSKVKETGIAANKAWDEMFAKYTAAYPELAAELSRRIKGEFPDVLAALPKWKPGDAALATRKTSEFVLNGIADVLPELIGGSADLTGSNYTRWKTATDFQADATGLGKYSGRYIRFGVREHGMAAICNGLAAYGALIPFGATFLNFISYALGSVRLSALSKHQVIYVMTHDSIGLGEDGPTHQPIETLAELRALPNLHVIRPADGNETSGAYYSALIHRSTPTVMALSRQNLPQLEGSSVENTLKGAYVLKDCGSELKAVLAATGSEVAIALGAQKVLEEAGVSTRVVSFPSWELFEEQSQEYKESVFPQGVPVVSVEVMTTLGWQKYAHYSIGIDSFGMSAPAGQIYKHFGFTPEAIAEKVQKVVKHYEVVVPEWKVKPIIA